ncbi:TolC family protein [Acidobacteria bacterium AH-259-D05]|nr:TolC family protein [Acidobacteria bacterium AH-259-D05]
MKKSSGFVVMFLQLFVTGSAFSTQLQTVDESDFYAGDLHLQSYVEAALESNPALEEALARYRGALQKVPQVTSLPDPMLSFTQFIRNVETRVGPQLNVLTISQKFPWFGRLDLKGKIAFKEAAAQYQAYRARERDIIVQVKRAFYELSYIDRAVQITQEEQSLLEHYEELAETRYSTGQGLQQAVIKIQAEITKIINRLKILDQQRTSLVARLNTLMDRPPEEPLPSVRQLSLPRMTLNLEELYQWGEGHRQELKAAMLRIEKSEQAIDLAKKEYWPNVTLSAGMIDVGGRGDPAGLLMPPPDNGKNAYNFSVGINIPIRREKYQAGVLEATEFLMANRKKYLNRRNEMEFSIRDQVIRIETLREQVDLFEQILIPQAEEALRSTESAYETGQLGALELMDSERVLLEIRLINARYYADYLRALANLERAIGTRFPR